MATLHSPMATLHPPMATLHPPMATLTVCPLSKTRKTAKKRKRKRKKGKRTANLLPRADESGRIAPLHLTCSSQRGEASSEMALLSACLVSLVGQPTELSSCRRLPGGCGGTVAKVKAMQQLQQQVRHRNETRGLPATVASARARAVASARAAAARAKVVHAEAPHSSHPRGHSSALHRAELPQRAVPLHRATPTQQPSSRSSLCEQGGAAKPPSSVLSASKLNRMALGHNLSAPQVTPLYGWASSMPAC